MQNKFKITFIFFFILLISSCDGSKKDDFDFSNFKKPIKENIKNESLPNESSNSNIVKYELKPLKKREEIVSSFKFDKNDPFLFDTQTSNELSDIKLKGFLTISNKNYALVDFLDNEGSISIESIGGKNTNLLPKGASIKEINPSEGYVSITYLNEIFILIFEG